MIHPQIKDQMIGKVCLISKIGDFMWHMIRKNQLLQSHLHTRQKVVIWDIRVHPSYQGQGIGKKLMALAYAWAKERHAKELKVETQNNNVNACKFYQSMGFHLGTIDLYAYGNKEGDEIMLLWYKKIT